MNINTHNIILFFILVSGIYILPFNLSATEHNKNETEIITPEIPIELINETSQTIPKKPELSEIIEDRPQDGEGIVITKANSDSKEQLPLTILNEIVRPGELRTLSWSAGQSFSGRTVNPPVLVVRGRTQGPTLCLVAAVHGDELNGIEIVRRVLRSLDPMKVNGTVIGVPIVNIFGFTGNTRYLPDRRDLNRYFPGNPIGSAASRIAHRFFTQIINHCNYLVDFHTGSFKRNNLPQLRADMNNLQIQEFVRHFGSTVVLHKPGHGKTLRAAATQSGIPTVAFELGQPGSLQEEYVESGIKTINTLIGNLGILNRLHLWFEPQPIYYSSHWVRANSGGILMSKVNIGAKVKTNELLGYIINSLTNEETKILSPIKGRVLGMALNQFMLPGYAAFHIGVSSDTSTMVGEKQSGNNDNSIDILEDELDENENGYGIEINDEEEFH